MFHKSIVELQKIRKFVDKMSVEFGDEPLISNRLSDTSYTLTIAIQDLINVDKTIKELEKLTNGKI